MADVLLKLDQSDNGKNVTVTDVTVWTNTADTGVTHVTIVITDPNSTAYTVIDEDIDQPAAQVDLVWEIPAEDVGMTDIYDDGLYTISVTYTTSPASDPVTAQVLLDWNTKYYDFQLVKEIPYNIETNQFIYNTAIAKSMVFNALKRGLQYSASVGQITKANDILETIERFKLANK